MCNLYTKFDKILEMCKQFFEKLVNELARYLVIFCSESGENIKIFSKNLTLGGHTFQDGQRGSEVQKRVPSS